jgi:prepilin-type N-terminal cleavage/methylation domain-containing protein
MTNSGIKQRGFTLIEMMVVVAIVGVLAAVAIPTFQKYVKKSKSPEAKLNVERMYYGGKAYYEATQNFVLRASSLVPATRACAGAGLPQRHAASAWVDSPTWEALSFEMNDPFFLQYDYIGTPTSMQAIGRGDLDCDTVLSTFTHGATQVNGAFVGTPMLIVSGEE